MQNPPSSTASPYVGPRPFSREDQNRFFGRIQETERLSALVSAYSTVLLFSQSGAGKSSLINAGLIPLLEARGEFQILTPARVGVRRLQIPDESIDNIYICNMLAGWDTSDPERLATMTLPEYLRALPRPLDEFEVPLNRLLIIDQFEEIFTTYPERWSDRAGFFEQIRRALSEDTNLSILFAMREDYIAELVPYEAALPGRLGTRLRLERLRRDTALMAITEPLAETGVRFAPGVAEKLVDDLMSVPVETESGAVKTVIGEFVEPVVLQVVCDSLWKSLIPTGAKVIEQQHTDQFAQVTGALMRYYDECVDDTLRKSKSPELDAAKLRRWFGETLITPVGTRGTVYQGSAKTGDLANTDVRLLENWHIIRGEQRSNARWYELSHDRFIQPIQRSNELWQLEQERLRAESERTRAEKVERKYTGAPIDTSVYICYAPPDLNIARRLDTYLTNAQIEVWVDYQEVSVGGQWWEEIKAGIDSVDSFLIIASQNSLTSPIIDLELRYAQQRHKRIIPIIVSSIDENQLTMQSVPNTTVFDQVDPDAGLRNWRTLQVIQPILMRPQDDVDAGLRALLKALSTDIEYVREHTRLLMRARDWENSRRSPSYVLIGDSLTEAETWLNLARDKQPQPTALHFDYISASRSEETARRQRSRTRRLAVVVGLIMVIAVVIAVVSASYAQQLSETAREARAAELQAVVEADNAQTQVAIAATAQQEAIQQALTATVAQGQAIIEAANAQTQAAFAATAQNEALIQAATAVLAQAEARLQAQTATVAQGEAQSIALAGAAQQALDNGMPDLALAYALQANAAPESPLESRQMLVRALRESRIVNRYPLLSPEEAARTTDVALSVAVSPDGRLIAAGTRAGRLMIWDANSGAVIHRIGTGTPNLTALRFSPDGTKILIMSLSGELTLWQVEQGERLWNWSTVVGGIQDIEFNADGSRAFVLTATGLRNFDTATGDSRAIEGFDAQAIIDIAYAPTRRLLILANQTSVYTLAEEGFEVTGSYPNLGYPGGEAVASPITRVACTTDGRLLAVGRMDGSLTVFDLDRLGAQISHSSALHVEGINELAISPDGRALISSAANGMMLSNLADLRLLRVLRGHQGTVRGVAFSPDSLTAVSAAGDGSVIRWDVARNSDLLYQAPADVLALVVSPSGRFVGAGLNDGSALVINARTGDSLTFRGHDAAVSSLSFSPDVSRLVTGSWDGTTILWDVETQTPLLRFVGRGSRVNAVAYSPDGSLILIGTDDGAARLWNPFTGDEITSITPNNRSVRAVAFSPDGSTALIGTDDGALRWDFGSGLLPLNAGGNPAVYAVAVSADGRFGVIGERVGAALWNFERLQTISGEPANRPLRANEASVLTVAFSPLLENRRHLALTGDDAGNLLLWDVTTAELLNQYAGAGNMVTAAAFTPDGRGIISASGTAITAWRVEDYGENLALWARQFRYVPVLTCVELSRYYRQACATGTLTPPRPYPTALPTDVFTATRALPPTVTPTFTPTPSPTNTLSPTATPTLTPTALPTDTPALAASATAQAISTQLVLNDATATAFGWTSTASALLPTFTLTPSPTNTPLPTATLTPSVTATSTPTATLIPTNTRIITVTPLPTFTPAPYASACQAVVQGAAGSNIRATPVTGSVLNRLNYQARVSVLQIQPQGDGSNYEWAEIAHPLVTGWMRTDYLGFFGACDALGEPDRYPAPLQRGWWTRSFNDGQNLDEAVHFGWDFSADVGEPIYSAPAAGEVIERYDCTKCTPDQPSTVSQGIALGDARVFNDPAWGFGYGNAVITRYAWDVLPDYTQSELTARGLGNSDVYCMYAHLNTIMVGVGQSLYPRTQIGTLGNTGNSSGPQLHLECRANGGNAAASWAAARAGLFDPELLFSRLLATPLTAEISPVDGTDAVAARSEPGSAAASSETAERGLRLPVLAIQPDAAGELTDDGQVHQWFLLPLSSGAAWVRADSVRLYGDGTTTGYPATLDGELAASLTRAEDTSVATINAANIGTISVVREFVGHGEDVRQIAFSPRGDLLISGSEDNAVIVWDVATGAAVSRVIGGSDIMAVTFNADGSLAAVGSFGGTVRLYDVATDSWRTLMEYGVPVRDLDFNGSRLAVATFQSTVDVWDVTTDTRIYSLSGHTDGIRSVDFSPDGTRLVSGGGDTTLRLWSMTDGTLIRVMEGHARNDKLNAEFSPDGTLIASAAWDRRLMLWDGMTGESLAQTSFDYGVNTFAFSPDGTRIAVGTLNGGLTIIDSASGEHRLELIGHTGDIGDVDYAPDGALLISVSYDDTLRVWTTETGGLLNTLAQPGDTYAVTVNADQTLIAVAGANPTVRTYGLPNTNAACIITALQAANIRTGPGPEYTDVGDLLAGETRTAIGRGFSASNALWWQIDTEEWVWANTTRAEGNCDNLPISQEQITQQQ